MITLLLPSAGGVAVPVNTNLKWKELLYIMEDTQAAGILIQDEYRDAFRGRTGCFFEGRIFSYAAGFQREGYILASV